MKIDELIKQLQVMQDRGHTEVELESDGWVTDFKLNECNVYKQFIVEENPEYPKVTRESFTNLSEEQIDYYMQSIETQKAIDKRNLEESKFTLVLCQI